jgi:hypothetical protein
MTATRYNPEDALVQDFATFMATGEEQMTDLDVIQEIAEEMQSRVAEGDIVTFPEAVQDYYGNLMDDLHDSAGDREYQAAHLERMAIVEKWAEAFTSPEAEFAFTPYTLTDKAPEIRWFFGEEGEIR